MRDERLTCVCGGRYWPAQAWIHAGCAINTQRLTDSINTNAGSVGSSSDGRAIAITNAGSNPVGVRQKSGNGRSREDYNAYMKDYMRRLRARSPA